MHLHEYDVLGVSILGITMMVLGEQRSLCIWALRALTVFANGNFNICICVFGWKYFWAARSNSM